MHATVKTIISKQTVEVKYNNETENRLIASDNSSVGSYSDSSVETTTSKRT